MKEYRCTALTAKGLRCAKESRDDTGLCGQHSFLHARGAQINFFRARNNEQVIREALMRLHPQHHEDYDSWHALDALVAERNRLEQQASDLARDAFMLRVRVQHLARIERAARDVVEEAGRYVEDGRPVSRSARSLYDLLHADDVTA